ncbi:hypothetical protein THAOC_28650, partial [Thalassiosira oceanica]
RQDRVDRRGYPHLSFGASKFQPYQLESSLRSSPSVTTFPGQKRSPEQMEGAPALRLRAQLDEAKPTQLATCAGPARSPSSPSVPPKGFRSGPGRIGLMIGWEGSNDERSPPFVPEVSPFALTNRVSPSARILELFSTVSALLSDSRLCQPVVAWGP